MSSVDISYVSSAQPNVGGTSLIVTSTNSLAVVSFSYIVFSGENASSEDPEDRSFINRTVNVGSDNCYQISSNGSVWVYHLFVETQHTLCLSDYFVVVSALYTDGSQSPFQDTPTTVYLTPKKIVLGDNSVIVSRRDGFYADAVISVYFTPCELSAETSNYVVAVQYIDGTGVMKFTTLEGVYDPELGSESGGVQVTLIDENGVSDSDMYVAIQGVRIIADQGDAKAIGELSDTILAIDEAKPRPPEDLYIDYIYNASPPTATLHWTRPSTYASINVDYFLVYKSVNGGTYQEVSGQIPYTGAVNYEWTDTDVDIPPYSEGDVLSYYVVSVNEDGQSPPSNVASITLVEPSSPPVNLQSTGLLDVAHSAANIIVTFQNPLTIGGDVEYGYETAYFEITVYKGTDDSTTPIRVVQEPYNSAAETYSVAINDLTSFTVATGDNVLYISCNLVTFNVDGSLLEGQYADSTLYVYPIPFITNVNGNGYTDVWTTSDPLQSFDVYTYAPLIYPEAQIVAIKNDTNTVVKFSATSSGPNTVIPDTAYEEFAGATVYHYAAVNPVDVGIALSITAANASGYSTVTITGSIA